MNPIHFLVGSAGLLLIFYILWEGFETIIVTRTIDRPLRLTTLIYRYGWRTWVGLLPTVTRNKRETYLGYFGSLSLLFLIVLWAIVLIVGFSMLQWAQGTSFTPGHSSLSPASALYLSGTTFFTLGYGDITPTHTLSRFIAVSEAGVGFGFLAVVIGYLPIMYQSFSKREGMIALLDARAGTPPSGAELIRRAALNGGLSDLDPLLKSWEQWSAELLEGLLSYPVIVFYRSQHEGVNWLSALTTILDACTLIRLGINELPAYQAHNTFAMGRHAAVDLTITIHTPPDRSTQRLSSTDLQTIVNRLRDVGLTFKDPETLEERLADERALYEPYLLTLASRLRMQMSPWVCDLEAMDNWETSAWDPKNTRRKRHF